MSFGNHVTSPMLTQQWVFRLGVGVTVDGTTFDVANAAAGVLSGDTAGPWTIRAPDWARSAVIDGCGAGGGGGGSNNTAAGGGGGSGVWVRGYRVAVIPGESITVTCTAGGAGGLANSAGGTVNLNRTECAGALFCLRLPGGEGGNQTGTAGRSGMRLQTTNNYTIGNTAVANTAVNTPASAHAVSLMAQVGALNNSQTVCDWGGMTGSGGATNTSTQQGALLSVVSNVQSTAENSNGAGGHGGLTPFSKLPAVLAGANGASAANATEAVNGYGMGGAGAGVGAATTGGAGTSGLIIITFMEAPQ